MRSGIFLTLALAAVAVRPSVAQQAQKGDPNVLTAAEITAQPNISNAEDAIRRLRPKFLRDANKPRSTVGDDENAKGPVIYVDECKECGVALRNIVVAEIVEIRFIETMKAMALYGDDHRNGAIFVTTTKGQRKKP